MKIIQRISQGLAKMAITFVALIMNGVLREINLTIQSISNCREHLYLLANNNE
jgi:hypothetical protein